MMSYYPFSLVKPLINHYISGSGKDFYLDRYETTLAVLNDVNIESMIFRRDIPSNWSNQFSAYYQGSNWFFDKYTSLALNFSDALREIHKNKIKEGATISDFPFKFNYATSQVEGGSFHVLGSFTSYVYGAVELYDDGRWFFRGYKNIYDYWNFDMKNWDSFENYMRNLETLLASWIIEIKNIIDNPATKTEPFVVKFSRDYMHFDKGKVLVDRIPVTRRINDSQNNSSGIRYRMDDVITNFNIENKPKLRSIVIGKYPQVSITNKIKRPKNLTMNKRRRV